MTAQVQADPPNKLARLIGDLRFYCKKMLKIRTKSGRVRPLEWNDAQIVLHEKLEAQLSLRGWVRAIVLKGRQQGISTYTAARFYHKTTTSKGLRTLILTHEIAATNNLFGMAKMYYENAPEKLRPLTKSYNGTALDFEKLDSGYRVATAGNKSAGRSGTIQLLHGSEVAFWPNAELLMAGLGQSLALEPGTEAILESTANGLGNVFHQMWLLAVAGKSDYMAVFIPWFIQKEYSRPVPDDFEMDEKEVEYMEAFGLTMEQMAWRQAKTNSDFRGNYEWFDQEYPATPDMAFLRVGHKALIKTLRVQRARKVKAEHLQRIGAHVIGVDCARFGDDSTCIIHRQGRVAWGIERIDGLDTMAVVGKIVRLLEDDKTIKKAFIDIGTFGAGVYDRLVELGYSKRVMGIDFGSGASDARKYANKRAEMWGEMGDWIDDPITPSIPDDDILHADLTAPGYKHTSNGQILLQKKEDIKKELGRSPDTGDALALTFAFPVPADDVYKPNWLKDRIAAKRRNKSAMSG